MEKPFEELDYRQTPLGDLILQRRRYLQLDNRNFFPPPPGPSQRLFQGPPAKHNFPTAK